MTAKIPGPAFRPLQERYRELLGNRFCRPILYQVWALLYRRGGRCRLL